MNNTYKGHQAYRYSNKLRWQSMHVASQCQGPTVLGDFWSLQSQSLSPTEAKKPAGAIKQCVDKSSKLPCYRKKHTATIP